MDFCRLVQRFIDFGDVAQVEKRDLVRFSTMWSPGLGSRLGLRAPPQDRFVGHLVGRICKRNPILQFEVNFSSGFFVLQKCNFAAEGLTKQIHAKSTGEIHLGNQGRILLTNPTNEMA